jgi:hypothetical protein
VNENVLEKPVEETITTTEPDKANKPKNPEKDKKKNKKRMLVLFTGIGLVTLCTTIFLFTKSTSENKEKSELLPENQSINKTGSYQKTTNSPSNQKEVITKKNKAILNEKPVAPVPVVQKTNPIVKEPVVVKINPTNEIIAAERADPLKYLSFKKDEGKKNIVNVIKINIEISNKAKYVGYSKIELKTFYFDKNGDKIGHDTKILYIIIKPGAKYTDELKFSCPIGVKSWDIKLKSATAAN